MSSPRPQGQVMDMRRRTIGRRRFLEAVLGGVALAALASQGWVRRAPAQGAARLQDAFAAARETDVVRALFGGDTAIPSDAVEIEAPYLAMPESGVDVAVRCGMQDIEMIAVVTTNNRHPLNSVIALSGADGYYGSRIRIERTSPVTAYVRAGGKLYSASATVKITGGGYGMYGGRWRRRTGG